MPRKIIAGNWKMNLNLQAVKDLVNGIKSGLDKIKSDREIMVFPSSIHLSYVAEQFQGTKVIVGAQNTYPSKLAAYTGEICTEQIADYKVQYTLLGHSERRQFLGETNELLNTKIKFTLDNGFNAVYCIGETLQERESNQTFDVVKTQLVKGLAGIAESNLSKIIIAYEPVWAIGTGKVATPEQAQEVHGFIRSELKKLYSESVAKEMSILYGGSVKSDNIQTLLAKPDIDGGLVGGASQKADSYLALF